MALAVAKMLKENQFKDARAALDAMDKGELTKEFINVVNLNYLYRSPGSGPGN